VNVKVSFGSSSRGLMSELNMSSRPVSQSVSRTDRQLNWQSSRKR